MTTNARPHATNRRVTISDVAREAHVSVSTVSNVLNERYGEMLPETRARVEAAIAQLGYRPSSIARGLRTRQTAVIGLIVPSGSNGVYPAIIKGAQDTALKQGYDIFICSTDRDPAKNAIHVSSLLSRQVDGIIFVHSLLPTDAVVQMVVSAGTPVLVFAPTIESWPVSTICLDNVTATTVLVDYLFRLGHQNIAYANHSLTTNATIRIETWRKALARRSGPEASELLLTEQVAPGSDEGYEIDSGRSLARRLLTLPDRPTAIIGGNDLIAAGLIVGAKEVGFRVPGDVTIVGFDDLAVGRVTDPTLTTMAFPKAAVGEQAFKMLIQQIHAPGESPQRTTVAFDLVVRQSSGPASHPSVPNHEPQESAHGRP